MKDNSNFDVIAQVFANLLPAKCWVPYRLSFDVKRQKSDKIPSNGQHGLSTANPEDWLTFKDAIALVSQCDRLEGVGLVMTGGVTRLGGSETLMGLDFDDVDFDKFEVPYAGYYEKSPSGRGIRGFVWVPSAWAADRADTVNAKYPNCHHVETYVGTGARFLTVTGNMLPGVPVAGRGPSKCNYIRALKAGNLGNIQLNSRAKEPPPMPDIGEGKPIDFKAINLSPEQRLLVTQPGKFQELNRSDTLHGLLIKLVDAGASREDLLATLCRNEALWVYCTDHRPGGDAKATQFAQDEINRAWSKSLRGMRQALGSYSEKWAEEGEQAVNAAPQPVADDATDWRAVTLEHGAVTDDDLRTADPPWPCATAPIHPRGVVTLLIGAHGIGKSTEALFQTLDIAAGRDHYGMPTTQGKAIFISCEDPRRIIKARLQAWLAAIHEEERPSIERLLRKHFYFFGDDETGGMRLTVKEFGECKPSRDAIEHLVALGQGAVSITLETVAMLNSGDEMNTDIMQLMLSLKEIARRTGATVQVIHHVSKDARNRKPDSYMGRGASSLGDAARSVLVMQELSDEEIKKFGITRIADVPVIGLFHVKYSYGKKHKPIFLRLLPGPRFEPVNASEAKGRGMERGRLLEYLQKAEGGTGVSLRHLKDNCEKFWMSKREVEGELLKLELMERVERVGSKRLNRKGPEHDVWRAIEPIEPVEPFTAAQ